MKKCIIYHNQACSKSRATQALLRERDEEFEVIEYLKNPPSRTELNSICRQLEMDPVEIVRFKESRCSELGISRRDDRTREEWIGILCQNPILMERPIVVKGDQAAIGRPPERILGVL